MQIKDRVALITGGASGLGGACSHQLIQAGGRVVIVDVNEEMGNQLAGTLGSNARFVKADVTDEGDVKQAIEVARKEFGGFDIALNCAGIGGSKRVVGREGAVDLAWFQRIIHVNLVGTFNVTRLAAASMATNEAGEKAERGVIINTASIAAFDGQIGQVAYSASKGGIVGMTLPLARDFARHGIRVMTIAPGIFDTPLLGRLPEDVRKELEAGVPFPPRLGRPAEYAALAQHIIENEMLNGEVIRLDGALRMAPR